MARKIIALESAVPYELAKRGLVPGTPIEIIHDSLWSGLVRIRCRGATYFLRREVFNQLELEEETNEI
tara:strand:+ start:801 stop:1004 length:204 start_codon:yes stop_codon:yes gene_type:complete